MSTKRVTFMRIGNETISRTGHWRVDACERLAAKKGQQLFSVEHKVFDMSGRGRSGHDGRWQLDHDSGKLVKVEKWSECEIVAAV